MTDVAKVAVERRVATVEAAGEEAERLKARVVNILHRILAVKALLKSRVVLRTKDSGNRKNSESDRADEAHFELEGVKYHSLGRSLNKLG